MKQLSLALLTTAIMASSCTNQNNAEATTTSSAAMSAASIDPADAPVFKFEEDSYDFGQIEAGEKVKHNFTFKNVGKTPLIITDAVATCGCTVPEYPKEPVAPGEEATINVVFDSAGKQGMQNKVVTLTSNAVPSKTELHLIGDVKAQATASK